MVSQAVVIATGVAADGHREVLGFAVGDSEDGAFWTAFLRSLKARGLTGTHLVISDAHSGLKAATGAVLLGAAWQRCRVHFMRNVLARVPRGNSEMVAAAIRTMFAQPDAEHVHSQLDVIAGMLGRQFPQVEALLRDAEDDLLAFTGFPVAHWKKVWSTNPLERLNKEIKRPPGREPPQGRARRKRAGRHACDAAGDRRSASRWCGRPSHTPLPPARR